MKIAPEGRTIVAGTAAAAAVAAVAWGWSSWPMWLAVAFVVQFFREPQRDIVAAEDDIVSPADGRVVFVGRAQSPGGDESVKISVFMNVFNAHANRSPCAGAVARSERFAGRFFNAELDKSSTNNERHLIEIDGVHGKIACMQVAGFLARRVFCHARVGDQLSVGQRYGFIRFGSRADVYLPPTMIPAVAPGDHVQAGLTRLASPPPPQ